MAENGRPSRPEAGPLHGYTVVELSTGIAGAYCTKLLADGGAQVIKVESPQGDPLRCWSASGARIEPASDGALFGFLACSKHIVLCRDQLHQDRGVRTCAARNPSQRHSTRPHADRRADAAQSRGSGTRNQPRHPAGSLGRPGHVDEIASTAVFLASEMASYTTGQTIHVDG
jgi:hypothetical protein